MTATTATIEASETTSPQLPPGDYFNTEALATVTKLDAQTVRYHRRALSSREQGRQEAMPKSGVLNREQAQRLLDYIGAIGRKNKTVKGD